MKQGISPGTEEAWEALDRDDFRFAETRAREVLARDPQDGDALFLLGSTFLFEGRLREALPPLDAAAGRLRRRGVGFRLGYCQFGLGELAAAESTLRRETSAYPESATAHNMLGTVLASQGRHLEALACFRAAMAADPAHGEARINAGTALHQLGRNEEALPLLQQATAAQPGSAQGHISLGMVLRDLERYEEAAACFARGRAIDPAFPYALTLQVLTELHACDWRQIGAHIAALRAQAREMKEPVLPFTLLGVSDSPLEQLQATQLHLRESATAPRPPLALPAPVRRDRVRIAYVSADFHDHATAHLMTRLFELHDRRRFEVTAISYGPDDGSFARERLRRAFDRFVDVRTATDLEAAQAIAALGIDIAVDLKGHTAQARLGILAARPATIQVTYIGYPGTTGAPYIDYVLADKVVIPPEHAQFYTEKPVWLPGTYQVNDDQLAAASHTPSRTELGLPESGFVFCAFNNAYKLRPETFAVWMRLLAAVPGSVLWLLANNPAMERNLREAARASGVAPERLVFAPRMPLREHLARHRCADLFLDTLPYNAHTTASDALRTGLPVVTCMGGAFAARVAASLLHAVGMPELVTHRMEDYEALALQIAREPQKLRGLRAKLERNLATQALFDSAQACRHIEAAYETMWERCLRGEPPAPFTVEPRATS